MDAEGLFPDQAAQPDTLHHYCFFSLMLILIVLSFGLPLLGLVQIGIVDQLKTGLPPLPLAALSIKYLANLQASDDELVRLEFLVVIGDSDRLIEALERLSNYAGLQSILQDAKGIFQS